MNKNHPLNLNEGSMVTTISVKSITEDDDVVVVTRARATTGEDSTHSQVLLAGKKKALFDITTKKINSLMLMT